MLTAENERLRQKNTMLQDYVVKVQTGVFDERVREMNEEARTVAEQQSTMEAIVRGNFEDRLTKQAELGFLRVRDSENKVRRKIKEFEREAVRAFVTFSEQLEEKIGQDRERLEESARLQAAAFTAREKEMYTGMIIDREELKATWRQMVESDVAQIAEQFKRMYIDACLNVDAKQKIQGASAVIAESGYRADERADEEMIIKQANEIGRLRRQLEWEREQHTEEVLAMTDTLKSYRTNWHSHVEQFHSAKELRSFLEDDSGSRGTIRRISAPKRAGGNGGRGGASTDGKASPLPPPFPGGSEEVEMKE